MPFSVSQVRHYQTAESRADPCCIGQVSRDGRVRWERTFSPGQSIAYCSEDGTKLPKTLGEAMGITQDKPEGGEA